MVIKSQIFHYFFFGGTINSQAMENNWKLLEDLTSLTDDLCEKLKNEPYQNRDALFDIQNTLERIKKVKSRQNVSYGGFDTSDRKVSDEKTQKVLIFI